MRPTEDQLRRLQQPGDEVWIEHPEQLRKTSYGVPYYDFVLYRMCDDGEVHEVDRKHYDPADEDFITPL
jgi:hypothetical protein